MNGFFVDFTCRWFGIEIGYSYKYDATGIWLFGPHHNQRSRNGALRSSIQFIFWWLDQDGTRLWLCPWKGNEGAFWPKEGRRFRFSRWKMDPRLKQFPVRPTEYRDLPIARHSLSANLVAAIVRALGL